MPSSTRTNWSHDSTHRQRLKNQDAYGLADVALGENNEWNELHFVSRATFAQMAPSVLTLEINRLGKLLDALTLADPTRNNLVVARFRLSALRDLVSDDFDRANLRECDQHLSAAILAVGLRPDGPPADHHTQLDNIADRLAYVRDRLRRLR